MSAVNLSTIAAQSWLGRVLRLPLRLIPADRPVPILQGPLRGMRWIPGAADHGCWLGWYEHAKQRALADAIGPGHVVLDIGANVGFYTLLAARRVGAGGTVVAFEPMASNVSYVQRHLALNRLTNVQIVRAAVADRSGTGRFATHASRAMGRLAEEGDLDVPLVWLDALFREGRIPRPDVIKIDVEGAELNVLRGAASLVTMTHPVIFLATHGTEVHRQCCQLLRSWGYGLAPIGHDGDVDAADEIVARPGLPGGQARE
jgi:FkbM family methyltransferase